MNVIKVENVTKSFNEKKVIDNLSFAVKENTILGFIGPNGAGKTTTMKMILGLLKIDEGNIFIYDEKVQSGYTKTNEFIGYLPDVPEFYNYMKPKEYLQFCAEIIGMKKNKINDKCNELLDIVGLKNTNKKIGGFSRGMKQRLGIAQALINNPKILICDEPTSALDPVGRKDILDILKKIKKDTTIIFSTHILSDVVNICDDVLVINNGVISIMGSLDDIKNKYKTDQLYIEFNNNSDKNKFLKEANFSIIDNKDNYIIVSSHEMEQLKKEAISLFVKINIYPNKLEVVEPKIEKLLLEAVK